VDWTTLGSSNYVLVALNNVPIVGNTTGAFVEFLFRQGTPLSAFHLIGFSMGVSAALSLRNEIIKTNFP
jgi:hypothetical protein